MNSKIENIAKILGYVDTKQLELNLELNPEFREWWQVIENLVKENDLLHSVSVRYSDCCNAVIDNDEQSLPVCTSCGDRI